MMAPIDRRTAPADWGDWPPAQSRLDAVARRATVTAQSIAAKLAENDDPVIETWLTSPGHLAPIFFGPGTESVTIGAIVIPALRLGWSIIWMPATDAGKLLEQNARFDFEQERLRRDRTRFS